MPMKGLRVSSRLRGGWRMPILAYDPAPSPLSAVPLVSSTILFSVSSRRHAQIRKSQEVVTRQEGGRNGVMTKCGLAIRWAWTI